MFKSVPQENNKREDRGQTLIEVLIAVTLGVIMIGAAAAVIAPTLRTNTQATQAQAGTALGKELLDNTRIWSEGDWHRIANLSTTSANHYYLITSSSPFSVTTGSESVTVGTTTYTRYFYVDVVSRDGTTGQIVTSGGVNDPSTKKVTVVYTWPQSANVNTLIEYLTRSLNNIYLQSDWSGGPGQGGPATTTNSQFASSTSNVNYSSSTGVLQLKFQ